jgi:hypothetical protein
MTDAEVERELRKIGVRRRQRRLQDAKLREDTERVMKLVPSSEVSIRRACKLAGISRSSAYDEFL